jgi:hypothetical protein
MKQTVVGKLYMIGCGHCDALMEPWNQMKKIVGGKVFVVDDIEAAEANKLNELNQQHGSSVSVQGGYPTIFKIKNGGKVEYYNGERTAEKLASWALHRRNKTMHRKKKIMGGRSRRMQRRNRNN